MNEISVNIIEMFLFLALNLISVEKFSFLLMAAFPPVTSMYMVDRLSGLNLNTKLGYLQIFPFFTFAVYPKRN